MIDKFAYNCKIVILKTLILPFSCVIDSPIPYYILYIVAVDSVLKI